MTDGTPTRDEVERFADPLDRDATWNGDWKHKAADTLRALSAALERAERERDDAREALRGAQQDANDLVLSLETADRAMDRLVRERDKARAALAEKGE